MGRFEQINYCGVIFLAVFRTMIKYGFYLKNVVDASKLGQGFRSFSEIVDRSILSFR